MNQKIPKRCSTYVPPSKEVKCQSLLAHLLHSIICLRKLHCSSGKIVYPDERPLGDFLLVQFFVFTGSVTAHSSLGFLIYMKQLQSLAAEVTTCLALP